MYVCYRTIIRQHAWTTPTRLWERAYADGSRKLRVFVNLNSSYQQMGNFDASQHWAVEGLKRCSTLLPIKFNQAQLLLRHGKRDEAIAMLSDGLSTTPKFWQGWSLLARMYDDKQDWDSALSAYMRAHELRLGQDSDVANQIGALYYKTGRLDQALPFFEIAYNLDPKNGVYAYNIGMLHLKAGRREKAQEWELKIPTGAQVLPELHQLLASPPKN